ncbi:MAG TPA: hemerythrin domain-containing protein [Allosphingosinicella sp.]|nr:hemerythrin domain-containing protein [Allosphingosinicella sp.]
MADTNLPQDGLQLLANDHRKVEALFEKFEAAKGASVKEQLVRQICTELKVHAQIEEEIYYPAIRGKVVEADLDEAYVEHDSAKLLINELEAAAPDESFYDAKVKVLSELIEHHVKEEEKERDNLFQQTRAAEIDLEALGAQLQARKDELLAKAKSEGLPPAEAATLAHEEI